SGTKWFSNTGQGQDLKTREAPVGFETDTPKNSPNETEMTGILNVLTSHAVVAVTAKRLSTPVRGRTHVSRQSPNPRRRKGTAQGPRGIQARDRREVRHAILHHQLGWKGCTSISLRGMGTDRAEVGRALHLQSYEEKVSGSGELLRTDGRDGRSGTAADPATGKGQRAGQGRGSGAGQSDFPNRAKPGSFPSGDRGAAVHV